MVTGFVLGRTVLAWHLVAGAAVMTAIAWRLIWGLLGTTYARFASFAFGPAAIVTHLVGLGRDHRGRHLGHNPLGALMVCAMLVMFAAIGVSGTIALGGMLKQGPLRAWVSYDTGVTTLGLHKALAVLLLGMIGAHLVGVLFESWRGDENLVAAMMTGRKSVSPAGQAAAPIPTRAGAARARPGAAAAVTLTGLASAAVAIALLAMIPASSVPPRTQDPVFLEQCGACHMAYPPSLAPASTWTGILANLGHHFGLDASLSPDEVARIGGWLDANSAEHWDTLPSHLLRKPSRDGSLRITDTPGWRGRHRNIAPAVFAGKSINGRANCSACHSDAETAEFKPQDIAIPPASGP